MDWAAGRWTREPSGARLEGDALVVGAAEGSDFWRTTHYGFLHDDGHGLLGDWPADAAVEVTFDSSSLTALYDQAGSAALRRPRAVGEGRASSSRTECCTSAPSSRTGCPTGRSRPCPTGRAQRVTIRASRGGVAGDAITLRARTESSGWRTLRVAPFTAASHGRAAYLRPDARRPRGALHALDARPGRRRPARGSAARLNSRSLPAGSARGRDVVHRPEHVAGLNSAFTFWRRASVSGGKIAAVTSSPCSWVKFAYGPRVWASGSSSSIRTAATCSSGASAGSRLFTMKRAWASRNAIGVASGATRENAPPRARSITMVGTGRASARSIEARNSSDRSGAKPSPPTNRNGGRPGGAASSRSGYSTGASETSLTEGSDRIGSRMRRSSSSVPRSATASWGRRASRARTAASRRASSSGRRARRA